MDKLLSTIGACSVVAFIIFLIKIINNKLNMKSENNKTYKFDDDDDE